MASSSKKLGAKANLLGKRKLEEDLETKPFLRKHNETDTTKGFVDSLLSEKKSDEANLISLKETVEGLDETPEFVEQVALPNKTLFLANLPRTINTQYIIDFFKGVAQVVNVRLMLNHKCEPLCCGFVELASSQVKLAKLKGRNNRIVLAEISDSDFAEEAPIPKKTLFVSRLRRTTIPDIIDFFKDVGQVVRVQLMLTISCRPVGCGFVEFASANEAKMALQKKNGEYLHNLQIFLDAPNRGSPYPTPKFSIDHKFWYEEDCLEGVNLPIGEDAAVTGLDKNTPHLAEDVLLIANLSPQTTRIEHFINFFNDVGRVISVRLIVNRKCKHVGYGFVEFASSYEAKKALEEKNGRYLDDHKILLMKGLDKTPTFVEQAAVRNKTLFVRKLSRKTEMSDIINFFKDVGEVVHVRLIVDDRGKPTGDSFVEFASANEAKKAQEEKNGEYLHNKKIILKVLFETPPPHHRPPRFCMDHKVCYEDYLQRESLVEGLDETPDCAEEVSVQKRTVFVRQLHRVSVKLIILIISKFKHFGRVNRVRIIVDSWGEHVGCCFVELATAAAAKKAVRENHSFFLFDMAEMAAPHPFRPNYNLAEKLWYQDNLRREQKEKKNEPCGKKTTFPEYD